MEEGSENKPEIFESAEDLYHDAPCGYVSFKNDGTIYNINKTLLGWLGFDRNEIIQLRYLGMLRATTASRTALDISHDRYSISLSSYTASANFSSMILLATA